LKFLLNCGIAHWLRQKKYTGPISRVGPDKRLRRFGSGRMSSRVRSNVKHGQVKGQVGLGWAEGRVSHLELKVMPGREECQVG